MGVPLRVTMESLGAKVDWDQDTRTVLIEEEDIQVKVPIGKPYLIKNGQRIPHDTAAVIREDRTYIPIRAVLEAFGADVGWIGETQTVTIDRRAFYGSDGEAPSPVVCTKDHPGDFTITTDAHYPGNVLAFTIPV